MPSTYNLFISHSWAYGDNYDRLVKLLRDRPYFLWRDYSVPRHDPIHTSGTDAELHAAITAKIQRCHVILILAGVYATYSKWINKEIRIAQHGFTEMKPIVAIQPWGAQRTSLIVKDAAHRLVAMNTESIVSAIRDLA